MSTSSSNRPPPDEESSRTAETDRLVEGIEKTRSEMSGAMAALESRFSPDNLRGKVEGELHHVEEKVREVVKEQLVEAKALIREGMNEAESKIKHGLSEVRLAVKQDLADQLDDTEAKIRKGLADAKDSVKTELREAFTGAKQSVRAATLGRVEDLATTIGDSMNTTRETIVETVRNNPIPAALAGFGIAWLLMSRSSAAKRASGNAARYVSDAAGNAAHRLSDVAGNVAHQASDAVGSAAHFASDTAVSLAHGASDVAGRVAGQTSTAANSLVHQARDASTSLAHGADEAAHYLVEGAQSQARRAEQGFQTMLQENPLALGAAAVIVGGVIGYILPRTHAEDMLMGDARAQFMHRAEEATSEASDLVGRFAEKTAENAKEILSGAVGGTGAHATR